MADPSALSLSGEGLWLRQGGARGQGGHPCQGLQRRCLPTSPCSTFLSTAYTTCRLDRCAASSPKAAPAGRMTQLDPDQCQVLDRWLRASTPKSDAAQHNELHLPTTLTTDRIRDTLGTASAVFQSMTCLPPSASFLPLGSPPNATRSAIRLNWPGRCF